MLILGLSDPSWNDRKASWSCSDDVSFGRTNSARVPPVNSMESRGPGTIRSTMLAAAVMAERMKKNLAGLRKSIVIRRVACRVQVRQGQAVESVIQACLQCIVRRQFVLAPFQMHDASLRRDAYPQHAVRWTEQGIEIGARPKREEGKACIDPGAY